MIIQTLNSELTMLRNFSNEDLERFLKQSADGLRMRPSEKVWRNLAAELLKRRRKVIAGTTAFVLSLFTLGYVLIDSAKKELPLATPERNHTATSATTPLLPRITTDNHPIAQNTSGQKTTSSVVEQRVAGKRITSQSTTVRDELSTTTEESLNTSVALLENIPLFTESRIASPAGTNDPLNAFNFPFTKAETPVAEKISVRKRDRLSFQFFFTPTISYRKLGENKSFTRNVPQAFVPYTNAYDVNTAVTHKPDIGLELGFAAKYGLADNVKLRGGLQFNISRYDIRAFTYRNEIATIALNTGYGVQSVSTVTNYRNFNGNRPDWLENFYFQLSAPVGLELKLGGNDKAQLGVAGALQPTYILGDKAYMISSDYKNYAQVPWLVRRWNVAANAETFVTYSTGKIGWQVGPQVRYQLLSSFNSRYPVKENLFDFGLKVGISANK